MYNIGEGLKGVIIFLSIISIIVFWAGSKLIDTLFVDNAIRTREPIKPEIELIVEDNIVDTIYVYRKP